MSVHFCSKTGVRLVAPGVSKAVDPEKGHDEFSEAEPGSETKPEKASKDSKKPKDEKPSTPPPAEPGSETKPEKASK